MMHAEITTESGLSALLERIDALELSIERKASGGCVCRIKMETMLGDYGDGAAMSGDELRLLGRLITKVYDTSEPDDEDESEVVDVLAPIDLDDDDGDIPVPRD